MNITTCHVAAGRKKNEIIIDYGEKSVSFFADSAEEAMDWMKALENNSKRVSNAEGIAWSQERARKASVET